MKKVNFDDFKETRNLYKETTKFHLKDGIITTDRMFGYPNSGTIVYTNKDTFIYSDSYNEIIKIHKLKKNEILFSHFLFDLKTNTLTDLLLLDKSEAKNPNHIDPFVKLFNKEIKGKEVSIISYLGLGVTGKKIIAANDTPIVEVKDNKLKRINFEKAKSIPTNFLYLDEDLEEANLPNVLKISDYSFYGNYHMKMLNAPRARKIGRKVLWRNTDMKMAYIPLVNDIGPEFLRLNTNKEAVDVISNLDDDWIKMQNKNVSQSKIPTDFEKTR
ncbi:hypothetical protein HDR59_00340 [bacterium]|nr:hypothetical protein [bacterium]